ncbi:MAG: TolC family protein [Myxococcaceae bacterium]
MSTPASISAALICSALAQTPVGFDQARQAASTRAPDVRLGEAREEIARASIRATGVWPNPTLTVSTATQTSRLSTGLSQPLPVFGQLGTQRDAAAADHRAAQAETTLVREQARADATLAWLDLWEAQARSELLAAAATDAERLASVAKERFDAGSAPRVDVVRAHAALVQAKADSATQSAAVGAAGARLESWLGRSAGGWRPDGEAKFPARPPELSSLLDQMDSHPALRHDAERVAAAAAHLRAERRQRVPTVAAQVTVSAFDPTLPVPGRPDVIGGLSVDLPLFDQRQGLIARAEAEQRLAVEQSSGDRVRFEAQAKDAFVRAAAASARVTSFESEVVPSVQQARTMTEEAYRDGRVDLLRLLDAQRSVLDARLSALDARAAYARAMAELERATGADLSERR